MNNSPATNNETENTPVTMVGVLICDAGKVLLVREDTINEEEETYELPMGKMVVNETLEGSAIRELYEQTGLMIAESSLEKMPTEYDSLIEYRGKQMQIHLVVFRCVKFDGGILSMFGDWVTPEWVDLEKLSEIKLLPNVDKIIKEFLDTANI